MTIRFSDLNLAKDVATAIEKIGYETPTPIQAQAIPPILEGRDIQGIAQTGTGKTAAFSLPILSHIADDPKEAPKRSTRVLILTPTRELASQIGESLISYGRHIEGFRSTVIFGGVPVSKQVRKLVPGNDVIVATPGRLLDLLGQKIMNLSAVEYLVLDEADQMMDMGFIHALRKIIPLLPKKRQTLFFSATMPKSISKLASQFLTDPIKIAVSPESTTAERVDQSIMYATKPEKANLLPLMLLDPAVERALVFTRTKHGADRVVKRLATMGLDARAIHGNKSQSQRTRALKAFKDGEVKFLIATDVAARGIDIRGVSHVFNYEIPNVPEQYIHRIGRTGRAGESGIAISFIAPDEKAYLKDIQKILKQSLAVIPLPDGFAEKSKELKKRPAIKRPDMPDRPPRRQKDRKSRPSGHRKGQAGRNRNASKDETTDFDSSAPRARNKPPVETGKPSRAERKRDKAGTPPKSQDGKSRSSRDSGESRGRPQRRSDNRSDDTSARRQSGTRNEGSSEGNSGSGSFKRKPKPAPHRGASSNRGASEGRKPSGEGRSSSGDKRRSESRSSAPQGESSKPRNSGGYKGGPKGNSKPRSSGGETKGGGWSSPKRKGPKGPSARKPGPRK